MFDGRNETQKQKNISFIVLVNVREDMDTAIVKSLWSCKNIIPCNVSNNNIVLTAQPWQYCHAIFPLCKKIWEQYFFYIKKMEQSNNLQEIINDPKLPERKIEKVKLYKCIEKLDDW